MAVPPTPVPPVSVRPLRKDAAENRERLLLAAAQVFAEQGLEASVEEVARVAGVGMGTLYRRFPTKEALIGELVLDLQGKVLADAHEALATPDGLGLETFLVCTAARQSAQPGCLSRLWKSNESAELSREIRGCIAQLTVDAQAHGRVRLDVTVADVLVLLWSLRGVIESTQSIAPDAWRRHLAIIMPGLRPTEEGLSDPPLTDGQLKRIRAQHATR